MCNFLYIGFVEITLKKVRTATYTAAECKIRGDIFFGLVQSVAQLSLSLFVLFS